MADSDMYVKKIGITPWKVSLCVRKPNLQFVLLVKCSYC